jgi:hypothetical protein
VTDPPTPYYYFVDLAIDAEIANYAVVEGDLFEVQVTVSNFGNVQEPNESAVILIYAMFPHPPSLWFSETRQIKGGESLYFTFWTTATEEGWFFVEVDPYNTFGDVNHTNNDRTIYYRTLTPTPDLDDFYAAADGKTYRRVRDVSLGEEAVVNGLFVLGVPVATILILSGAFLFWYRRR